MKYLIGQRVILWEREIAVVTHPPQDSPFGRMLNGSNRVWVQRPDNKGKEYVSGKDLQPLPDGQL